MNCVILDARKVCNRCSNIQSFDSKYCCACGVSFVFGEPDAWKPKTFTYDLSKDDKRINSAKD